MKSSKHFIRGDVWLITLCKLLQLWNQAAFKMKAWSTLTSSEDMASVHTENRRSRFYFIFSPAYERKSLIKKNKNISMNSKNH